MGGRVGESQKNVKPYIYFDMYDLQVEKSHDKDTFDVLDLPLKPLIGGWREGVEISEICLEVI